MTTAARQLIVSPAIRCGRRREALSCLALCIDQRCDKTDVMSATAQTEMWETPAGNRRGHIDQSLAAPEKSAFAWTVLVLFAVNVGLSIALVRWQVASIPVRSFFALASLGMIAFFRWEIVVRAMSNHRMKLTVIALVAFFGVVSSVISREDPAVIFRQLLEIHVQCAIALVLGAAMVSIWGVRRVAYLFIGLVLASGGVAILQFTDISLAWDLRAGLGVIQNDLPTTKLWYTKHFRALGVSMSPVILATQLCLAFIAYWALRAHETHGRILASFDHRIVIALALFAALSVVSGNRSPLLGAVVFAAIYAATRESRVMLAALAAVLVAGPVLFLMLTNMGELGLRVATTNDGSSLGRITLGNYGLRLFFDRPLGYGLGFDPREHWPGHWEYLQHSPNLQAIRNYGLHNFFLNSLNKYGVPIIFVAIFIAYHLVRRWALYLPFVVYMVHVYFHNDGPLQSDILIWYVLALFPLHEMTREHGNPFGRHAPARGPEADAQSSGVVRAI